MLWTPPGSSSRPVDKPLADVGRKWEQSVLGQMYHHGPVQDAWNPELKLIDRNLRLMQAHERAECPGVIPGFWHLVRLREPAENTVMMVTPLRGPSDEFVEPSSAMLAALRACDLQNQQVTDARNAATRSVELAQARARQRADDERLEHGDELLRHYTGTSVLFGGGVPWVNANAGRRARRA